MIRRAFTFIGGLTIITAWFVTLGVRETVGAGVGDAQVTLGMVPTAPPALPPLVLPAHDPFRADDTQAGAHASSVPGSAVVNGAPLAGGTVAQTEVPDIAALGGAQLNVGIMATITSGDDAYALVEDGGQVRIAHVGDALAGSKIASITDRLVTLANGVKISLDQARSSPAQMPQGQAPAQQQATQQPSAVSTNAPGTVNERAQMSSQRMTWTAQPPQTSVPPAGSSLDVSGYGHTVLTNPDGSAIRPSSSGSTTLVIPSTSAGLGMPSPIATPGGLK